ncbi:hypothetical protein [Chryseobacterium sp. ERMR1:04]|uniref:hypothetical protein n=1 Tax=Chryseobacterium sp. ERMR1:04 TaxID=1705393 RepID=UPI0006C894EF|nr:hypothetical protein [Chryseobacterium sp. ERMR1:04]KPH12436.1 hypothetical protein AMQ68_16120 [Chryseobacterium sp. ERMR1:04]
MIKLEIHTLTGQLDIEIKRNENFYVLLIIVSKSQYFKENGKVWSGKIIETERLFEIVSLIKKSYNRPSIPTTITINDGKLIKINLHHDQLQVSLNLIDIEKNTNEFELIEEIKKFTNEVTGNDPTLQDYLNLFMD